MVNYPNSLDNNASLYLAVNNKRTRLTSAIDELTLTIPVVTTSGFPTSGFITILSDPNDITKAEAIRYTNTTSTTFIASERGADGTPALPHRLADNCDSTIQSAHHNSLKDAVIALENFVGIQGAENFLRVDDHGNVLISGTLTTSGDATFVSDLDIKGNLTVTGTAHFGQTVVSTGTLAPILFASNDIEQVVSGTTFLPVSCETSPLAAGVDYLVIYTNNNANGSDGFESFSRILHGATPIGVSTTRPSILSGAPLDTHYGGGLLSGIYKVTGDGSSTVAFQARSQALINKTFIGAMAIVAIPLSDRFTENSDYFFDGVNSDTFIVSNAAAYPTFTTVQSTNFDLEADDYIVIMSVDAATSNGSTAGFVARFTINGQVYGPEYGGSNPPVTAQEGIRSIAVAHVVNIPLSGTINFLIEGCSRGAAQADFRRPRVFAIRKSLFTQVISTKNSVGTTTTNTAFQDFSGLNSTISPTNINSPIIVLGTSNVYTLDLDSTPTAAIRNQTAGIDYRDDSGFQNSNIGGTLASHGQTPLFLLHKEDRSSPTEYRARFRSTNGDSVTIGRNVDNTGGDLSEMILWEYALSSAPSLPIDRTSILDEQLLTGSLIADNILARDTFEATTITGTTGNFAGNISGQVVSGQTISGSVGKFSVSVSTNDLSVANLFTATAISGTTGMFGGTLSAGTVRGITVTGTTGQFAGTLSTGRLTAITGTFTKGITVGSSTTYVYPDEIVTPLLTAQNITTTGFVVSPTGTFSTTLTISGVSVMHTGITGVTVSGANLTKGQLNLIGSRGGNVGIVGNTITFDANPAGAGTGAGTPGGGDTQVQYNSGGTFAGDADFTFNSSTNTLSVPGGNFSTSLTVSGAPVATGTLTVMETDGSPLIRGVHTIIVSTGTLVNNGNGVVTISTDSGSSNNGAFTFTQTSPASTWSINHSLNSTAPVVMLYNTTGAAIQPDDIFVVDTNNLNVVFAAPASGTATLLRAGGGGGGGIGAVVEDTFPELGGNLNAAGFNITGVGTLQATTVTGTTGQFGGTLSTNILTAVTGTFTTGITVGGSTTYIYPDEIRTPLLTAVNVNTTGPVVSPTGTFSHSLTISGIPVSIGGGAGTPGGSNTQVQFNDSSTFGGDSGLVYNKTTDTLTTVTVSGTTVQVGGTVSAQNGSYSNSLTISGQPVHVSRFINKNFERTTLGRNSTDPFNVISGTIPANAMGTAGILKVSMWGDMTNSGSNPAPTMEIKFGNTTFWRDVGPSLANTIFHRSVTVDLEMLNTNSTSSQVLRGTVQVSSPNVAPGGSDPSNIGVGKFEDVAGATDAAVARVLGSGSVDTTVDQIFAVTVENSTTSAGTSVVRLYSSFEIV
jgi:hypothetical protein